MYIEINHFLVFSSQRKKRMFKRKNYLQELVEYIKKNLKKGYTKESLKWALVSQGYSRLEVEKAIRRVDEELASRAPVLKTKPIIKFEIIEPKEYAQKMKRPSFFGSLF